MGTLAARLGIEVPNAIWPSLVEAATFESMRGHSDRTVPSPGLWKDETRFFNRARSGEWRNLLDEDDRRRYAGRVSSLVTPDLEAWLHRS